MIFACVLRSGGRYGPMWVERLRERVLEFHPELDFRVLTDDTRILRSVPVEEWVPLVYGWPRWWSKLELFRPGAFPPGARVLYFDLDVALLRPFPELLALDHEFNALRGFRLKRLLNSSIMLYTAGAPIPTDIWTGFVAQAPLIMRRFRREGDQQWISGVAELDGKRLQDRLPAGYIRSFKIDLAPDSPQPDGLRILCFHGTPKAADLPEDHWARQAWERTLTSS
jgi:hypothetical protein